MISRSIGVRPGSRLRPCLLTVALVASSAFYCLGGEVSFDDLDKYVAQAVRDWEVPGLALGIVKDDKVVFAKGFGVRKLGEEKPIDADTLFAIGSASKAFTAASLAMLVDEGKLGWDDAATKYLPDLQLFDPYATRELSVRDLLCHRSGLPRGDMLWYATPYSRAEILRRLRHLKHEWSFRSHFGYQNIMFLAAGEIVPRAAGISWDDFVKQRVFLPLGMKSSNTSVKDLEQLDNVATPHVKIEGKVEPIAWRNIDNVAPAGSINSNVNDMLQWLRLQLGDGTFDGKRLLSSAVLEEMHAPQTIVPRDENYKLTYPDAHFLSYGLGWFLHDYAGKKIVEHGGAIDGMRSQVALIPEEKLGLVVLTNYGRSALPSALMFRIFDMVLKDKPRDWSGETLARVNKLQEKSDEEKAKAETDRAKDTKPSLALEKYVGTYADELYGEMEIRSSDGKLQMQRGPSMVADLEHWHYDTFRAKYHDRAIDPQFVAFRLDSKGAVKSFEIPGFAEFVIRAAK